MPRQRAIIVISDLHLGRGGMVLDASELQPLVEEASTLIINGDTAETSLSTGSRIAKQPQTTIARLSRVNKRPNIFANSRKFID